MKHNNKKKSQDKFLVNRLDRIALLQFFIGIISVFFSVYYYVRMLISLWTVLIFIFGVGVFFALITMKYYKKTLQDNFNLKNHFVISVLFFGFTITAILLSINYYLTNNKVQTIQRQLIVKEGYHRYGSGLYVETTIDGTETRIITLPQGVTASDEPKLFSIQVVKGCLGFLIIKDVTIIK